jgi:hypothetical protein
MRRTSDICYCFSYWYFVKLVRQYYRYIDVVANPGFYARVEQVNIFFVTWYKIF